VLYFTEVLTMKKTVWILILSAAATCAQDGPTVARLYDNQVKSVESEVVSLVEAMPESKFNFAPTNGEFKGVRTFAQQAKHLAAVTYLCAAAAANESVPVDTGGEAGPESAKTKAQVVQFLKASFAYAHQAMDKLTAENQLEMVKSPFGSGHVARGAMASAIVWHSFDHYGQMAVYARMNGVVPPASR